MQYTQFLIFERGCQCNLAEAPSALCSIALPDRYGKLDASQPLTDEMIIECVRICNICKSTFRNIIGLDK